MKVISTVEAESEFPRFLVSVEAGEEFVIARGPRLVALLVPYADKPAGARPRVGEMVGPPFEVPAGALAPLAGDELRPWGL